jgi:hypothetical protein
MAEAAASAVRKQAYVSAFSSLLAMEKASRTDPYYGLKGGLEALRSDLAEWMPLWGAKINEGAERGLFSASVRDDVHAVIEKTRSTTRS